MTTPLVRMIFGMQVPAGGAPMALTVLGSFGAPEPAMTAHRRHDGKTVEVGWVDEGWTTVLDPGDYIVSIEIPDWVAGLLAIKAAKAPGDLDPAFVYYGYLPDLGTVELGAWRATTTYVDPPVSSSSGDPKDPLPPPPPPADRIELAPVSKVWFTAKLEAAWHAIQDQLADRGGRAGLATG